jgi:hypothetical protein
LPAALQNGYVRTSSQIPQQSAAQNAAHTISQKSSEIAEELISPFATKTTTKNEVNLVTAKEPVTPTVQTTLLIFVLICGCMLQLEPPPAYQQRQTAGPASTQQQEKAEKKPEKKAINEEAQDLERAYAAAVLKHASGRLASTIPRFHFPQGRPLDNADNDRHLANIRELFDQRPGGQFRAEEFDELCRRMALAVYTKRAVYDACCRLNGLSVVSAATLLSSAGPATANAVEEGTSAEQTAETMPLIDFNQFCIYWNRQVENYHNHWLQRYMKNQKY